MPNNFAKIAENMQDPMGLNAAIREQIEPFDPHEQIVTFDKWLQILRDEHCASYNIDENQDAIRKECIDDLNASRGPVISPSLRALILLPRFEKHLKMLPKQKTANARKTNATWSYLHYYLSWCRESYSLNILQNSATSFDKHYIQGLLNLFIARLTDDIRKYMYIHVIHGYLQNVIPELLKVKFPLQGEWPHVVINCIHNCAVKCHHPPFRWL